MTQRFRRFKDDLQRERASEGATPDDGPNPLDQPDARVDWSDLPHGILHRVFQMLYREKGGRELVGVCGQVCRGWHDDALDVLMQDTAATRRPVLGVAPDDDGRGDDETETEGGETGAGGWRRGGGRGGRGTRGEGDEEDTTAAAKRETSDTSSEDDDEVGSKRRRLPDESEAASAGADDDGGGSGAGDGGRPRRATTHHRRAPTLTLNPNPNPTLGAPAEQAGSGAQDSAHCQHSDGSVRPA